MSDEANQAATCPLRRALRRVLLPAYRARGLTYAAAAIPLILLGVTSFIPLGEGSRTFRGLIGLVALIVVAWCALITLFGPRVLPNHTPVIVASPVQGRWLGMNSPASKTPSHGVRMYGQAFAIDLVAEPLDRARPAFGDGPMMRPASDYPAFGESVFAMIPGTVVRATGWRRDHRARSHWPALAYLMAEGAVRELGGPGFILGNHVTIRGTNGVYATVAHLQRGSLRVRVGETVVAGQQLGRCGNSGNSTEPHVHAQLMDRASPWTGQGIPMEFAQIALETEAPAATEQVVAGLPTNGQHMIASAPSL